MIYMRIDQLTLGQMIGDGDVGVYSAATRISEVWYFIPIAVASSASPAIYEAKKTSEALYYHLLGQLNRFLVLGSIGIALPMTFLSGTIMVLLFGEKYAGSGNPYLGISIRFYGCGYE
jgi:polysaccharide transporter, PST family